MDSFGQLLDSLETRSPAERRSVLTGKMKELGSSGIDCSSCEGVCCSFIANSMKTTPLEALDILVYLEDHGRINSELIEKLNETISHYRLDYDIDTGRGTSVRRTYTCPFYNPGATGCSISRNNKPYGCLGFNAFKSSSTAGESCAPDFKLLELRENRYLEEENQANELLKEKCKLNWDKLPMPVALIHLLAN